MKVEYTGNRWFDPLAKTYVHDTTEMLTEEETILSIVARHKIIPLWQLYDEMKFKVRFGSTPMKTKSRLIALTVRLLREGKLVRASSPRGLEDMSMKAPNRKWRNHVVLGPSYVPPMQDISHLQEDLSQPIRDVDGLSSLT